MKKIAIIGGGFLGVDLANSLQKYAKVCLIEPKTHFIHAPAMIRAIVKPELLDNALIPYDKTLKAGEIIQAKALNISGYKIELDNNSQVSADFIVVATGSSYAEPFKNKSGNMNDIYLAIKKNHELVCSSSSIAIVGAGAVGVELAGEIASTMPDKKITLISNKSTLFPEFPRKLGDSLLKKLVELGVEIIFEENVKNLVRTDAPYSGKITLSNNREIVSDLVFPVIGSQPNNEIFQNIPDIKFNQSGRVKVDPWLRPSKTNQIIFAAGDIAETGDQMTIVGISRQIPWLKKTLLASIKGKSIEILKPYTPWKKPPILIPLGPKKGASYAAGHGERTAKASSLGLDSDFSKIIASLKNLYESLSHLR